MFVGESGVARVMQRTCEVTQQHGITDPADVRAKGATDLETAAIRQLSLQRHTGSLRLRDLLELGKCLCRRSNDGSTEGLACLPGIGSAATDG